MEVIGDIYGSRLAIVLPTQCKRDMLLALALNETYQHSGANSTISACGSRYRILSNVAVHISDTGTRDVDGTETIASNVAMSIQGCSKHLSPEELAIIDFSIGWAVSVS